jgi:hypothetical protein
VPGGQDRDLTLGHQLLAVESGEGVERRVHERDVGAAVAQQPFLLAHAAQQHLDLGGAGLGRVGVEEFLQQVVGPGGLDPRTPEQGAVTAIRLAMLPGGGPSGTFLEDDGVIP